ncbi:MAG: hypothetical protein Q9223_003105 [Gallowayella weberi]
MSHGHGAMAITSIIEHPMRGNELSLSGPGIAEVPHTAIGPIPPSFRPEWSYGPMASADSPMYSSDSCSSPMSDYPNAQLAYLQRPPSTFSDSSFHQQQQQQQQPMASPLSTGLSYPSTWGPPLQLPFANVGEQQRQSIRNEPVPSAAVALGQSNLLKVHNPQTQHYLDCYWEHFHPLFPIVHFPSFMSTIPQPVLAASMVVIGAQYSPRPDAKQYSASLRAGCAALMSEAITSRSSVFDLQAIFHLEMFGLFRARSAKLEIIQSSPKFREAYTSVCSMNVHDWVFIDEAQLIADQDFLQVSQASLLQTLPPPTAPAQLQVVYRRWVEHEIRRRILVAMFVLDIQHSHLFQRERCYNGSLGQDGLDLPFPTSAETWNCPDVFTWRNLIATHEAFSISGLGPNYPPLDFFQSSLLTCCQVHRLGRSSQPALDDFVYRSSKSYLQHALLTHHALSLTTHTPLHALIITASESWLFGSKVTDEAVWHRSKVTLRKWITSESAMQAVWHATRLLRLVFRGQSDALQPETDNGGYLHSHWCIYVAALVCWAFGYGSTKAKAQPEILTNNAEILTAEYLDAMNVLHWLDVGNIAPRWLGSTKGLLESVRLKIGDVGMGGLLNGAEDVLFRLIDGESKLVEF